MKTFRKSKIQDVKAIAASGVVMTQSECVDKFLRCETEIERHCVSVSLKLKLQASSDEEVQERFAPSKTESK